MKKICRTCGEEKDTSFFYANNTYSDGLMSQCVKCHQGKSSEYNDVPVERKADMDAESLEYAVEYNKKHPIRNWDDEMIFFLHEYCTTPESVLEKNNITVRAFTDFMQMKSSYCLTRKEQRRMAAIERETKLLTVLEEYEFEKEEMEFLESLRRNNETP